MQLTRAQITLDPVHLTENERKAIKAVLWSDVVWMGAGWRGNNEHWEIIYNLSFPSLIHQGFIEEIGTGSFRALKLTYDGEILAKRLTGTEINQPAPERPQRKDVFG